MGIRVRSYIVGFIWGLESSSYKLDLFSLQARNVHRKALCLKRT